jgi:tricorn protease-like protein
MRNLIAILLFTSSSHLLQAQETRLLRDPDISDTKIVFAYANDLWTVDKAGGVAQRLTSFRELKQAQDFLLMENGSLSQVNTRVIRTYI